MALKDYKTSELLAEVFRRESGCPHCVTYRAELAAIADEIGEQRMREMDGYHHEAVRDLLKRQAFLERLLLAAVKKLNKPRQSLWGTVADLGVGSTTAYSVCKQLGIEDPDKPMQGPGR